MLWLAAELWGAFREGRMQGALNAGEIPPLARGWRKTGRGDSDVPTDS